MASHISQHGALAKHIHESLGSVPSITKKVNKIKKGKSSNARVLWKACRKCRFLDLTVWVAMMTCGTGKVVLTASLGDSDAIDSCQLLRNYG